MVQETTYHFAGFTIEPALRRLRDADGRIIPLGSRAFDTLLTLVKRPGELVEKRTLLHAVWGETVVEPNSLERCISMLRRALDDSGRTEPLILTEWGRGYRLTTPVIRTTANAARPPVANTSEAPQPPTGIARRLLLQGQALLRRGDEAAFATALDFLRDAIDADPAFAQAHSAYALAHVTALICGWAVDDPVDTAEHHARRALEVDPLLAEGHAVLGQAEAMRCRWREATDSLRSAAALAPENAFVASEQPISVAANVGHLQDALSDLQGAHEREPADPLVLIRLASVCGFLGREPDTSRALELSVRLGYPAHVYPVRYIQACNAHRAGRDDEAARQFLSGLPPRGAKHFDLAFLGGLFKAARDGDARAATLPRLRALCAGDLEAFDTRAVVELIHLCGTAGAVDCAFLCAAELPRRLRQRGYVEVLQALWMPELRDFRRDPRFASLAEGLNLARWWRETKPPDPGLL